MASKDVNTKRYLSDPKKFAELFNIAVFKGERVVRSEDLVEQDPGEIYVDIMETKSLQRVRDNITMMKTMTDGKVRFLLLGIENQSQVDYKMPVRAMVYDALNYDEQVKSKERLIRTEGGHTGTELISGFRKTDKLIPVITLVVYWGKEKWDGPVTLYDMFDPWVVEHWGAYIENYRPCMIHAYDVEDEMIEQLETDLRELFLYLKHSQDQEKLREVIEANLDRYEQMDPYTAQLINTLTGSRLQLQETKERKIDMCKAIDDMREASRQQGIKEGKEEMAKAIADMREESRQIGIQQGIKQVEERMTDLMTDMEMKSIENVYTLLTKFNPGLVRKDIIEAIANQYGKPVNTIQEILS